MNDPDFMLVVADQQYYSEQREKQLHLHQPGRCGGSNLLGCNYLRSLRMKGKKLPELTGMRLYWGATYAGRLIHEDDQDRLKAFYDRDPNLYFMPEVYIEHEITPGLIAETPIDEVLSKRLPHPYIRVPWHFKNQIAMVTTFSKQAQILKIGDIKSAGDFGFYKYTKDGLSPNYVAQGLLEMKATGLTFIDFRFVHKEKGYRYVIRLHWDEERWQKVVNYNARLVELLDLPEDAVKGRDCGCLWNRQGISWYHCPLAETLETSDNLGRKRLQLVRYCPMASQILKKLIHKKMPPQSSWKFGRSIVKVLQIRDEVFKYQTKSQLHSTNYNEVSIYKAWSSFKPLQDKPWPKNQDRPRFLEYQPPGACNTCGMYARKEIRCGLTGIQIVDPTDRKTYCEDWRRAGI